MLWRGTLDNLVENDSRQQQQTATPTALFAALPFFLATAGLYGVISFAVASRRKEIGIRMALGARRRDVIT
jgi:ABC-type antimicrobial peptide transport system permease subunit